MQNVEIRFLTVRPRLETAAFHTSLRFASLHLNNNNKQQKQKQHPFMRQTYCILFCRSEDEKDFFWWTLLFYKKYTTDLWALFSFKYEVIWFLTPLRSILPTICVQMFLYNRFAQSISVLSFQDWTVLAQKYWRKCALKMLMKFTSLVIFLVPIFM